MYHCEYSYGILKIALQHTPTQAMGRCAMAWHWTSSGPIPTQPIPTMNTNILNTWVGGLNQCKMVKW